MSLPNNDNHENSINPIQTPIEPIHNDVKVMSADQHDQKASLWTVFKRSAGYERQFLRNNSWDYVMLIWLPLITILGMWWVFSKPYIVDVPIGVIDKSDSSYSHTLIRYLDASPDLQISKLYQNWPDANDAIIDNNIYGVVIIPDDFASSVNQGMPAPVIFKVNAQYGTHSGIAQRGVQTVVGTMSAGVEIKRSIKKGLQKDQAQIAYSPIGIERISLFNVGTDYQQFLASTVLPALLHILIMIIGATTIGRELRDRTLAVWYQSITSPSLPYPDFKALKHIPPMEKLTYIYNHNLHYAYDKNYHAYDYKYHADDNTGLMTTNGEYTETALKAHESSSTDNLIPHMPNKVSIPELMIGLNGKLIWALLAYMLWGALVLTLSMWIHPTSLESFFIVFIAFTALTMISLWLGAILCLTSYSLRMGLSSTAFISAPSYAFAGVTFPLLSMSEGAQRWSNMLPLTPYLKVHISQMQMLAPHAIVYPTILGLISAVIGTLLVTALLCIRAFKHPERWGAR